MKRPAYRQVLGGLLLMCTAWAGFGRAEGPRWDREAAARYVDGRLRQWSAWSEAREAGGGATRCVSCHTTVPLMLAWPRVGQPSAAQETMLGSIRARVSAWEALRSWNGESGVPRPFYNGRTPGTGKREALATEAVLNALVLTDNEPGADHLSPQARRSLDILWSQQNAGGSWDWLTFDLRPWEQEAQYLGAAWAAVAVGKAGPAYFERSLSDEEKSRLEKLRTYLREGYADASLHHRLHALWASSLLPGVLHGSMQQALIKETLELDREGEGWALTHLARRPNDRATWRAAQSVPPDAASDAYATALALYTLLRGGADFNHPRLRRAAEWLVTHGVPEGRGPAIYLNVPRDPNSADPEQAQVGKFMHDAAAAFAILALDELSKK